MLPLSVIPHFINYMWKLGRAGSFSGEICTSGLSSVTPLQTGVEYQMKSLSSGVTRNSEAPGQNIEWGPINRGP